MDGIDAPPPKGRTRPGSPDEIATILRDANHAGETIEIRGGGSRRDFGGPVRADAILDLSGLDAVEFYEPEELVIKVGAGATVARVEALLAEHGQCLAHEPQDHAAFFGRPGAAGTIGGNVACNLAGPRRILSGGVRDSVLGVECVSGGGEAFKAGGRTVKNVTGYDLPKLLCGSFGTLAVLTSVALKVHPAPRSELTFLLDGLADPAALTLLAECLRLPVELSGAVHAGGTAVPRCTALRLDGVEASVAARSANLAALLARHGRARTLQGDESRRFWRRTRDLADFGESAGDCVWRLMLPAHRAAGIVAAFGGRALYDWGGSLVHLRVPADTVRERASALRAVVAEAGGNACLFRAPDALRREIGVFQRRPEPLRALNERIRRAFDPQGVLNPGRLSDGAA